VSKYYAGVGSRNTPGCILSDMTTYAARLEKLGYILRSGGAQGADKAFEHGVTKGVNKTIFHPTKRWSPSDAAMEIAAKIHPAWDKCSAYARACHGRNVYQVLGENLDEPVEFVICWTPSAEAIGGTRTAIKLAEQHSITVYNLANPADGVHLERKIYEMEMALPPLAPAPLAGDS